MVNAEVLLQLSVMTKPSPDGNWGYPQPYDLNSSPTEDAWPEKQAF